MNKLKVVIVTTGQPSTNPRMLKELDALTSRGYTVKVLYSHWADWAYATDKKLISRYPKGTFIEIGGNPFNAKFKYFFSRILHKTIRISRFLRHYSLARTSYLLISAAIKQNADLYIAHTLGALPPVSKAAERGKVPLGFDAEDYHSGESATPSLHGTIEIQNKYFPKLNYLTVSSPLIGEAYQQIFPGIKTVVINNVFSRSFLQPGIKLYAKGDVLKIFWFSQTISAKRGIEDVIIAMGKLVNGKVSFSLLGYCADNVRRHLLRTAQENGLNPTQITFLEPVEPSQIFKIAADHHIGMATETGHDENNRIALSNKIFTYILSGLAVVASDTPAQKKFINENSQIGKIYKSGNNEELADIFRYFLEQDAELNNCRKNSISLAAEELNWEKESKKFLSLIDSVLHKKGTGY